MKKSSTLVIASALLVTLTTAIAPATTFAASSKATVKPETDKSAKTITVVK